jgi:hypothetical protein
VTDNLAVDFQSRPCDPAQTQAFLPTLHPQVRVEGDVGLLPCVGCFADRRGRR